MLCPPADPKGHPRLGQHYPYVAQHGEANLVGSAEEPNFLILPSSIVGIYASTPRRPAGCRALSLQLT